MTLHLANNDFTNPGNRIGPQTNTLARFDRARKHVSWEEALRRTCSGSCFSARMQERIIRAHRPRPS